MNRLEIEKGYALKDTKTGEVFTGKVVYTDRPQDFKRYKIVLIDDVEHYVDTDLSYGAQITSLIRDKYSLDAELAATHNGGKEYLDFLEYRRRVKSALI